MRATFAAGLVLQAAGAAGVAVAGFWVLAAGDVLGAAFTSAFDPRFGVDGLSGLFLGTLGLVAAPALVFSLRYLEPTLGGRAVAVLTAAFVLALAAVLCARDPLTFLAGWELMTLLPAALILVARDGDRQARETVFSYVAITHLGGAGTWIAILLLAQADAIGDPSVISTGSGLQVAIALAALVGMGTKAGVMPLHVWLPRAHPIAPAPVSALMSGVMIKVAIYGLVRVLVDWLGILPVWFGVLVLGLGALSAVGGVVYALFQHELKRLLALHSIENVGIIVLGLGACLILRARGADEWAAFALGAALLHTLNHAVFKALLFLGAGSFEKAVGSLELDRLGGLLRRMPWTGAAFLVGAMAIAGLPPLNGFASEWLTLQALLHVPLVRRGRRRDRGRGRARGARRDRGARGLLLRQGRRARAARPAAPRPRRPRRRRSRCGRPSSSSRGPVSSSGSRRGCSSARSSGWRPGRPPRRHESAWSFPERGRCRPAGSRSCSSRSRRARAPAWPSQRGARADLGVRPARRASARVDERRVHEAAAAGARGRPASTAGDRRSRAGGIVQDVTYSGHVPHLIDDQLYRPVTRVALAGAVHARRLQSGRLGTYVAYLIGLVVVLLAAARIGVIG